MMPGSPEAALNGAGARTRTVRLLAPDGERRSRKGAPRALRLLTLAQCAAAKPRGYIVKGLLAPGDLAVMFGPPGAGKSVIAPFLAHAVAAGRGIFGRRVRCGPVLYIAAEDGAGMKLRAAALRQAIGDAAGLFIVAEPVNLQGDGAGDPPDLAAIVQAAERIGAALIVLDTLASAFPGLDENDGRDMGRAVRLLRELRTPDRAVLVIHHGAKSGGSTPRGHGVLDGAADVTLRIEVPEDRASPRTVKLGKNRNGTTLASFAFTIRAETLGTDDDGDPITAPIAEEAEGEAGNIAPPLPDQSRRALDYLSDLLARAGNTLPSGPMFPTDAGLRCVGLDDWRAECAARTLCASDEKRAVNQAFKRSVETLIGRRLVATADHAGTRLVWLAKRAGT